ncbi:MAG: endonuclease III [Anaerolineales bacterium]
MTREHAQTVHLTLLEFYGEPVWRNPLPPLDELVSTILSQNTNDVNRDKAFDALRAAFPTWETVRDASPESVIAAIRPAGLANQKGPRIQNALQSITQLNGSLDLAFLQAWQPEAVRRWLMNLDGVGPKTAAIVMLFSLRMPAFPVDTHVYRVSGRLGLRPQKMSVEQAHPFLEDLFAPEMYYAAHLNLIRLGREICAARKPNCPACPLQMLCETGKKLV